MAYKILFSIIVPIYNAGKILNKCIDSIVNQSHANFELILINDGSLDDSGQICDDYALKDTRIKVYHTPNSGVSAARNNGIRNATGSHIIFVDADDWIDEDYLNNFYDIIKLKNIDLVVSGYCYEHSSKADVTNHSLVDQEALSMSDVGGIIADLENRRMLSSVWGKSYKREIITDNNLHFDTSISFGEDTIFTWSYLLFIDSIATVKSIGYHYIQYDGLTLTKKIYSRDLIMNINNQCFALRKDVLNKYNLNANIDFVNKIQGEYVMMAIRANLSMYNPSFYKNKNFRYEQWKKLSSNKYFYEIKTKSLFIKTLQYLLLTKQIQVLDCLLKTKYFIFKS